jgi:hypothetical protein
MKTDPPSDWDEVTAVEAPAPLRHPTILPKRRSSDGWPAATQEDIEHALREQERKHA